MKKREEILQVIKALKIARDRVRRGWTQLAMARTETGLKTSPLDPNATCWCLAGALQAALNSKTPSGHALWSECYFYLTTVLPDGATESSGAVSYNDHPETKQADVVALIERAIERARADVVRFDAQSSGR